MSHKLVNKRFTDTSYGYRKRWQIAKSYNEHKLVQQPLTDQVVQTCKDTVPHNMPETCREQGE